jgi:hypothetical protein
MQQNEPNLLIINLYIINMGKVVYQYYWVDEFYHTTEGGTKYKPLEKFLCILHRLFEKDVKLFYLCKTTTNGSIFTREQWRLTEI